MDYRIYIGDALFEHAEVEVMKNYKGKKILIVGLARSGIAAARYLLDRGATVTITDIKQRSELEGEIKGLMGAGVPEPRYFLGSNPPELFIESDLVVVSPGVPFDIDGIKAAGKKGVPVICEMELGLSELEGRVVAITGTNGKSTTTALAGEFLKDAGKDVWVGGNIGKPLIGDVEGAASAGYVVLEVSSYQLEVTPSLSPGIAVWLNATPDHLDRYRSFEDYVMAKALIGRRQDEDDCIIYNYDDPLVSRMVGTFKSRKIPFSLSKNLDVGAFYDRDRLVIKGLGPEKFIDTKISKLKGLHNRENIAAAALVAALSGVGAVSMEKTLAAFEGLPHRLQFVRDINGVKFYNDSKGTNVGAVVKSLQSFDVPVVLIAGGQGKNTGFAELRGVVAGRVKGVLAIGETADEIRRELGSLVEVTICSSLQEAVRAAFGIAKSGDVVLLSPACASFDMFDDYAHRGRVFTDCVNSL